MRPGMGIAGGYAIAVMVGAQGACALQRYEADYDEVRTQEAGSRDSMADSQNLVPPECTQLGAECGLVPNSLGGVLDCGLCEFGQCEGNHCMCTPKTCSDLGDKCGPALDNGCGGVVPCSCSSPSVCFQEHCCTPKTCAQTGCGTHDDGCGGTVLCGTCCTPRTCSSSAAICGSQDDGCGGTVNCSCQCSGIAGTGYVLCDQSPTRCTGVYLNGQGCAALCARAGMTCRSRYGSGTTCNSKESDSPWDCAANNGHNSNWCECM